MHRYLWEGKDAEGVRRSEQVDAENAQEARADLTRRGWTELRLVLDEVADVASKGIPVNPEFADDSALTPESQVAMIRGQAPGFFGEWAKSVWESKGTNLFLLALTLTGFFLHQNWLFYCGVAALGFQLLLHPALSWWFGRTLRLYSRLNAAKVWGRWEEVLQLVQQMRSAEGSTGIGVGKLELVRCRAQALAALGNLDQAVREFSRFEHSARCPRWMYLTQLADIHDNARQFEQAQELRDAAVAENPESGTLWIDHASALVRRLNRPAEARASLARAIEKEVPEIGLPYLDFVRGLIAWREGDPAGALASLEKASQGMQPHKHHDLMEGIILLIDAYRALMHGLLGQKAKAGKLFNHTEAFLIAHREDELLAGCRAALGR